MSNNKSKLFVFDIETIPDTSVVNNLTGCNSDNINDKRQALEDYHLEITEGKNAFLRQPFHKIVVLSYALFDIEIIDGFEVYTLKHLRSGGDAENYNEEELVKGFFSIIEDEDKKKPRIVTFNGRTFDIPVLKYRAMKYGISCKPFYEDKIYQYRYNTEYNCDLIEVLSDFGASARIKLNEVSSMLGLPGKFGVDGSKVTELYDAGNLKVIRDYCETDVLNTYLVYLRYALHIGKINTRLYNSFIEDVLAFIEKSNLQHLNEFKEAWEKSSNSTFLL